MHVQTNLSSTTAESLSEGGDNVERRGSNVADRSNAQQPSPDAAVQNQNAHQADLPTDPAQLIQPGPQPNRLLRLATFVFTRDSIICYSASMPWQFRLPVRLSVRPSVRPSHRWISQKRLKLGSRNFHHTVAPPL